MSVISNDQWSLVTSQDSLRTLQYGSTFYCILPVDVVDGRLLALALAGKALSEA